MATTLSFRAEVNGNILDAGILEDKAWISDRNERFPVKIRLILRKRSTVEKIQIVAHDKYIPQEVVISATDDKMSGTNKRMGVVEFIVDSNGQHELKTIYTDIVCTSVILHIEKAHANDILNPLRQVALVKVQIFGRYDLTAEEHTLFRQIEEPRTNESLEDGRFTAEIDELLQRVEKNKQKSVENESFGLASLAQLGSRLLQKARGEMDELEKDQRDAIREEDFHRALDLQDEMKTLRRNVLATVDPTLAKDDIDSKSDIIDIHRPKNLFEKDEHDYKIPAPKLFTPIDLSPSEDLKPLQPPMRVSSSASTTSRASLNSKKSRKSSSPSILQRSGSASSDISLSKSSLKERPTSVSSQQSTYSRADTPINESVSPIQKADRWHSSKFLEKENTVVPALKERRHHDSDVFYEERDEMRLTDSPTPLVPVMEKATFSRGSYLFGEDTMKKLYSKKWEKRKEGLTNVQRTLEAAPSSHGQAADYLDCAIAILQRRLKDPLHNAYAGALDFLSFICTDFLPKHSLYKMAPTIAKTTSDIIALRASDTDRRSAGKTLSTINDIMEQDAKIAKYFLNHFLKMGAPSGQRGQAAIVQNAVESLGAPNAEVGLTEENVTIFGQNCLRHTDPEIRTIGRKLIFDVYANGNSDTVRKVLIEENGKNKHTLLQAMLREMAELDAKQNRQYTSSTQSGSSKKRSGNKVVRISNDLPKRNGSIESACRFCGRIIDSSEPSSFERHYRADCPMFTKCGGCGQVTEVSSLGMHKRTDCRVQNNYRTCSRCGELIDRRLFHKHIGKKDCKPPDVYSAKCPLCGSNVLPDNNDGWRRHLTAECEENSRRRMVQERKRSVLSNSGSSDF